jgi:hypothetical protein
MNLPQEGEGIVHALQVINNQKVSDHHAIIPTRSISGKQVGELSALLPPEATCSLKILLRDPGRAFSGFRFEPLTQNLGY